MRWYRPGTAGHLPSRRGRPDRGWAGCGLRPGRRPVSRLDVAGDLLHGHANLHAFVGPLLAHKYTDSSAKPIASVACILHSAMDRRDVYHTAAGIDGRLQRPLKFNTGALDTGNVAEHVVRPITRVLGTRARLVAGRREEV